MGNISITIPLTVIALVRASDMLHGLAKDIGDSNTLPIASKVEKDDATPSNNIHETVTMPETVETNISTFENPDITKPDKTNLFWDARIHTGSQLIVKRSGEWKLIRNTLSALVEQVRTEQANITAGATGAIEFELGANGEAQPTTAESVFGNGSNESTSEQTQGIDFAGLMMKITNRQTEKPEFKNIIDAVLAENSVASLPALIPMTDAIPVIDKRLDELWVATYG